MFSAVERLLNGLRRYFQRGMRGVKQLLLSGEGARPTWHDCLRCTRVGVTPSMAQVIYLSLSPFVLLKYLARFVVRLLDLQMLRIPIYLLFCLDICDLFIAYCQSRIHYPSFLFHGLYRWVLIVPEMRQCLFLIFLRDKIQNKQLKSFRPTVKSQMKIKKPISNVCTRYRLSNITVK